ncbi:uncharacterized protein EAF01_003583 [Botrytis porri]|uniref:uncharacterized protein n=1 Tax=Botrytis porri TaxID=87229 RepID=UPI0018FF854B|nr:uncharacterized protein EAF01_003583 [Botrytis porri]KAF7909865.1 hypothetical protein EAF01_003583 [Botrytis porri]
MEVQSNIKDEFGSLVNFNHAKLTFRILGNDIKIKLPNNLFYNSSANRDELDKPRNLQNLYQGSLQEVKAPQDDIPLLDILRCFAKVENDYERYKSVAKQTRFYSQVCVRQTQLVTAYVVETLSCSLTSFGPGQPLEKISYNCVHERVTIQTYGIVEDANLTTMSPSGRFLRTSKSGCDSFHGNTHAAFIRVQIMPRTQSLRMMFSRVEECLTGSEDSLCLIFGRKFNKKSLENVYTSAPMFTTAATMLSAFILKLLKNGKTGLSPVHFLEVGGGTGGSSSRQSFHNHHRRR